MSEPRFALQYLYVSEQISRHSEVCCWLGEMTEPRP